MGSRFATDTIVTGLASNSATDISPKASSQWYPKSQNCIPITRVDEFHSLLKGSSCNVQKRAGALRNWRPLTRGA